MSDKSFKITGGKGFHIKLPNGITISTQFGPANYGDNYDCEIGVDKNDYESDKVEIAVWNEKGEWYDFADKRFKEQGCDVVGYKSVNEWLEIFNDMMNL